MIHCVVPHLDAFGLLGVPAAAGSGWAIWPVVLLVLLLLMLACAALSIRGPHLTDVLLTERPTIKDQRTSPARPGPLRNATLDRRP